MTIFKKFLKTYTEKKEKMSCKHFLCTLGCQKQNRGNSQDHSGRESIPDNVSTAGLRASEHELVGNKKAEKLPRIPKIGASDPGLNWAQRRCKSMTVLDS